MNASLEEAVKAFELIISGGDDAGILLRGDECAKVLMQELTAVNREHGYAIAEVNK